MASTIMHLAIAKEVNKKLNMNERELFLGTLAPDISKEFNQNKEISHFLDPTLEYETPNINNFLKKYKDSLVKPFEMGYFIHLLADKYWYKDYINKYIDRYSKTSQNKQLTYAAIKNIIYNDYTNINNDLINTYNLNLDEILNNCKVDTVINEIQIEKIEEIVNKLGVVLEDSKADKTFMFDTKDIKEYIDNTAKNICKDIDMLKIFK